ncbi:MAG TPA: hypothetical protein PLG43_13925, partial [Spirochaetia bacterium]|nr:hypothetical protein [Spirochaetia bacterium]
SVSPGGYVPRNGRASGYHIDLSSDRNKGIFFLPETAHRKDGKNRNDRGIYLRQNRPGSTAGMV